MNELYSAVTALCDEVGLDRPDANARGRYELNIDGMVLRVGPWNRNEVVLEGVIGSLSRDAARNWENQQELLRTVLTWNLARLKGQARPEVLSFDEEENILLLWRSWPLDSALIRNLLKGVEEMLNELEFWRSKIAALSPAFGAEGKL